jgi:DNA-binding transcriptional MerR regulator
VDWNVDALQRLLKLIVAKRAGQQHRKYTAVDSIVKAEQQILRRDGMVLDEVQEIVTLPKFDARTQRKKLDPHGVQLSPVVVAQLRQYVESIACQYRDTPFHNFEHASHVTMCVSKLLSRIVAPAIDVEDKDVAENLHDHTYGITSDPVTQFAVIISALVHDVDHVGVSNFTLVTENTSLAATYKSKSIAEQNSVDLAWQTLMEPRFMELRKCIYADINELNRFRQLLVNTVLATEIFDKELQALRKSRWDKAFNSQIGSSNKQEDINRKATIVIEHLIQASDVAHNMQHWHI